LRYRDDVPAWRAEGGVVLTGGDIADRWEAAIEPATPGDKVSPCGAQLRLARPRRRRLRRWVDHRTALPAVRRCCPRRPGASGRPDHGSGALSPL